MKNTRHKEKSFMNAVFSVTIDFNFRGRHRFGELRPHQRYNFGEQEETSNYFKDNIITYGEIKNFIIDTINDELEPIIAVGTNYSVQSLEVLDTREGSIIVLFNAALSGLKFVSGFKSFYDSIKLIEKLANAHIKQRLNEVYGDYFDVNTEVLTHQGDLSKCDDEALRSISTSSRLPRKGRDGFFYYLLISNIVLLCLLAALVFGAVVKTYFT